MMRHPYSGVSCFKYKEELVTGQNQGESIALYLSNYCAYFHTIV